MIEHRLSFHRFLPVLDWSPVRPKPGKQQDLGWKVSCSVLVVAALAISLSTGGCTFDPVATLEQQESCGNGTMDPQEACDGTQLGGQTCASLGFGAGILVCRSDCHGFVTTGCGAPATCGNGTMEQPEECDGQDLGNKQCSDLGLGEGELACTADCRYDVTGCSDHPQCGNGNLDPTEQCDDGNQEDGDGCSSDCKAEYCGDGITQAGLGEECDDHNVNDGDGCSSTCIREFCGDHVVQTALGEACDDGNNEPGDGCSSDCKEEYCGDGIIQSGLEEECDDGNQEDGDGCSSQCLEEICGDGVAQPGLGEECDQDDFAKTCSDYPWMGTGNPACTANCTVNLDGCTDRPIGGPCDDGDKCASGICAKGTLFPGGYCTKPCESQTQCPTGTTCVEITVTGGDGSQTFSGCVATCTNIQQCRSEYECYDNMCLDTN